MFSRNKPAGPKAAKPGAPGLSLIGPEVVVSGDISAEGQLHVDGRIDGDVRCTQLCQGSAGTIAGNIFADRARVAGTVEGTVSARTLVVEASARIMGDVAYETISIEAGAQIDGRLARRAALGLDDGEPTLIATPVNPSERAEGDGRGLFVLPDSARSATS